MALPERGGDGAVDTRLVVGALAFLSAGTVRERIATIYEALAQPDPVNGGVPVEMLSSMRSLANMAQRSAELAATA